jgi:hypothetical protein
MLKGRHYSEDQGKNGRIILKCEENRDGGR